MFVSKLSPRVRNAFRISESNLDEEEPMTTAKFITRGVSSAKNSKSESEKNGSTRIYLTCHKELKHGNTFESE